MVSITSFINKFTILITKLTFLQYLWLVIGLLFLNHFLQWQKRRAAGFPPGPLGFPLIGSLPYIARRPYKTFADMAARYGDVFSLQFGTQNVVVINNRNFLKEAFVDHGKDFAGRPPLTVFHLSCFKGASIAFSPWWPKKSQLNRKLGHAALNKFTSDTNVVNALVMEEVQKFQEKLLGWLSKPLDPSEYIKSTVASIMISVVYGSTLATTYRDEFMELSKLSPDFTKNLFIASLVDIAPFLEYVFRRRLAKLGESINKLGKFSEKIFEMEKDKHLGKSVFKELNELVKSASPNAPWHGIDPTMIQSIMTDIVGAGVDTTSALIGWGIYLLATHESIQASLQEEIDSEDMPLHLKNRQYLPKLQATIMEVLRTKPSVPMGLPHYTLCDTTLGSYKIPKDTIVIANLWGVNHDIRYLDAPFDFNPCPFQNAEEGAAVKEPYSFSVGVRKCLGSVLAKQIAFLVLGSLLKRFTFTLADGPRYVNAGEDEDFGLILQPKKYKVIFKTR